MQAPTQAAEISQHNKVVESLNINWRSIEYEKTLYNPAFTSSKQRWPKAESLSLSFEIEKLDSGLILSACPDAVIERITDSRGNDIESGPFSSGSSLMYVHIPRFNGGFMPVERPSGPELPSLRVRLDAGLLEQIKGEIGLKGHFYALIAESLEYVELPFKPDNKWVSLTPDAEIRVREARNEASMYHFHIEQRPEIVLRLANIHIGDPLPSRLIVVRQTIVQTGTAGVGGEGSGGGTGIGEKGSGIGKAEKIRYTIAVNPAHQIIPFEIKRIPLSEIAEPVPSQARSLNRTKLTPVKRMLQQTEPQFDKKVADCFKVDWSSIAYSKTLRNSTFSTNSKYQEVSEKLILRCEAKILNPKLIIGTCDVPVIEQITDGKGRDTDSGRAQPRSNRMYYNSLQYQPSLIPTLPSSLIYWEGRARLALGLTLKARHRTKRASVLQPVHLGIQLDPGLIRKYTGEIGDVRGYFHALTAESFKHIEVPFKPDNKWVRLTSDVEIQVHKAWHTGTMARFDIGQRGPTGNRAHELYVGDSLPDGIVVERQFIGKDSPLEMPYKFGRSLPGPIGGAGSHDMGQQVEKIDYLIATSPKHNRIPFEVEHIPLPK